MGRIDLGLGAFAWQGFTYASREKMADIGPIEATKETKKTVPVPPFAGALSMIDKVVVVTAGNRRMAPQLSRQYEWTRSWEPAVAQAPFARYGK